MVEVDLTCYLKGDDISDTDLIKNTSIVVHSVTEKDVKNLGVSSKRYRKVITVIPKENNIIEDDYQILITRLNIF